MFLKKARIGKQGNHFLFYWPTRPAIPLLFLRPLVPSRSALAGHGDLLSVASFSSVCPIEAIRASSTASGPRWRTRPGDCWYSFSGARRILRGGRNFWGNDLQIPGEQICGACGRRDVLSRVLGQDGYRFLSRGTLVDVVGSSGSESGRVRSRPPSTRLAHLRKDRTSLGNLE